MAAKQPDSNPQSEQPQQIDEELRKIMLKLKEQGKLKDVPANLVEEAPSAAEVQPIEEAGTEASQALPADESDKAAAHHEQRNPYWTPVMKGIDSAASDQAVVAADVLSHLPPRDDKSLVVSRKQIIPTGEESAESAGTTHTPWTLQQFFDGEIDLEVELTKRFSTMPMMASVKFRTLGSHAGRRVATLEAADGSATLIIDADVPTKVVQLSFTYGSMLTLRFALDTLTNADRTRWLELMNREQGGLAFLWGPGRWQNDYMICIARRYVTNIYAFSPNNFEAAIRLTPAVMTELLNWLDEIWNAPDPEPDNDAPLLTW